MDYSFSVIFASTVIVVVLSLYCNVLLRGITAEDARRGPPPFSNVSTTVRRKNWGGIDAGFAKSLQSYGEPLVLQNTVAANFTRYTLSDISAMLGPQDEISSLFKHTTPVFGPYYDSRRPLHQLPSVQGASPYEEAARLPVRDIGRAFSADGPPYYSLSIRPEELGLPMFNISEMVSLHPQKSSVNLWLGMKGGTTPCHYDGYHNMYVQLSGKKKFVLFPPGSMRSMQVFPFLHPSYGQCGGRMDDLPWQERTWREVTLSPGELLYIPPFWLHEVVGITPSVAFNVWSGVTDEDIFQKILSKPIPGLGQLYSAAHDEHAGDLAFRPHFPLLVKELPTLSSRVILASFITFEVLHRVDLKDLLPSTIREAHARYAPLILNGTLEGVPDAFRESVSRAIDQWIPKPPVYAPAVWGMSVADKSLMLDLTVYAKEVSTSLRAMEADTVHVWAANFVEVVALQTCGLEKASWFIDIIDKKIEREESRRKQW